LIGETRVAGEANCVSEISIPVGASRGETPSSRKSVVSWQAALQIGKKNFKFSRADRTARPTDLPDGLSGQFRVQCARKKYFAWRVGRNRFIDSAIPPHRGALAIVTNAGRDAVDAAAFCVRRDRRAGSYDPVSGQQHADERCCSVRRSRVVLTPRRWRQVRGG
jgi:hypothetical protein